MQPEGDLKLWQVILGGLATLLCGVAGGAWSSRGVVEELRKKDLELDLRLQAAEATIAAVHSMAVSLAVLASQSKEMKEEITAIRNGLNKC